MGVVTLIRNTTGTIAVTFPYSPDFVAKIKSITGHRLLTSRLFCRQAMDDMMRKFQYMVIERKVEILGISQKNYDKK
jgi:hypothetical protein